jgi:putative tryptophan/tyrosine transport system substrate-binding protein
MKAITRRWSVISKGAFCVALCAMLFALSARVEAQQRGKVAKIGILETRSGSSSAERELLGRELRALGYIEDKNIIFEYRSAENKIERLPALADELIRLKIDVLLTISTPAVLAAKNATRTIPIVFYGVADPVGSGVVDSLARPGENITGITTIALLLAGKRLELLKEAIPKLSRVAVLWNPQDPSSTQQWKESHFPAREQGLQLDSMEVSSADKFEAAFNEAIEKRSGGLAVTLHALAVSNQKPIAELAIKHRLPVIYPREDFVVAGGLMSYGADEAERFKRGAYFIDRILRGTKPADLPVEQPTKFELVINLKTAKQIGLTIPPNVLARADKVIR